MKIDKFDAIAKMLLLLNLIQKDPEGKEYPNWIQVYNNRPMFIRNMEKWLYSILPEDLVKEYHSIQNKTSRFSSLKRKVITYYYEKIILVGAISAINDTTNIDLPSKIGT